MIVVDGRESSLSISDYSNLQEVLSSVIEEEQLAERIVTDVFVDDESFSELYPYQAEDIDAKSFSRLELKTVSMDEMAGDVVEELPKVVTIMQKGSRQAADLFRRAEVSEALEVIQDILGVSRELLATIHLLRNHYSMSNGEDLIDLGNAFNDLLEEIGEVMESEDWVLIADLMEFEFLPACDQWRSIIDKLAGEIAATKAA